MKIKFTYSIPVILISMFLLSCGSNTTKLPGLDETFSQKDKNPFGAWVMRHQLDQLYYHNTIRNVKKDFDKTWQDITDTASLYINISKNLYLSRADLIAMLAYVYNGNSLFISSKNIDPALLDTLGCTASKPFYDDLASAMNYTYVKTANTIFNDTANFRYFYLPFNSHFTKLDKLNARVLGTNKSGANFIVVFHGKGRFYLHLDPRALSNYFLLQKENYKYFQHVFSLTAPIPERVYWDDYYNKRNYRRSEKGNKSGLAVVLQYPAMAWAFWLLLLLIGLYIFFGGKRRQRIVPDLTPNTNATLTFTETIGRLYLQKKDNRNIADKLITYFLEHVRNHYYLNTSHINDEFITTLSRKSNNSKEGTARLFSTISNIQHSTVVDDQQLLLLNHQIENFNKNKI